MTATSPQAALHETPRSGFRRAKHRARVVRWTMLVALVLLLEAATRTGWIDRNQMVAPSEILAHVAAIIPSTHFVTDLTRTSVTILAAFALGVLGGVPLGVLLWRVRVIGRVLEPFIVTGYAMPTLLFYPILVAVLGLNAGPIIVIASTMALIPIALTTMVALGDVKPVLHKLARSVDASRRQQYFKVLFPAATPLIFPGSSSDSSTQSSAPSRWSSFWRRKAWGFVRALCTANSTSRTCGPTSPLSWSSASQ